MCGFKKTAAFAAALTIAASVFVPASAQEATEVQAKQNVELVSRTDVIEGEYKKYDIVYSQDGAASGVSFKLDMPRGMELIDISVNESAIANEIGFEQLAFTKDMELISYDTDENLVSEVNNVKIATVTIKTNGIDKELTVKDIREKNEEYVETLYDERGENEILDHTLAGYFDFVDLDYKFTPDKASAKAGDIITYDVSFDNPKDIYIFQTSLLFSDDLQYDGYEGEDHYEIPNDFDFKLAFAEDIDNELFRGQNDYTFVGMSNKMLHHAKDSDVSEWNTCKKGTHDICKLRFKAVNDIADTNDLIDSYYIIAIGTNGEEKQTTIRTFTQEINAMLPDINRINDQKKEKTVLLGDVNGSDDINVSDLSDLASHVKGIKPINNDNIENADVNKDGELTVSDISMIASHIKGVKAL